MATSLVVIAAALATGIAVGSSREPPSRASAVRPLAEQAARVTLAEVAPANLTYDLAASPVDDAPVGRRGGLEPPSAASVRRAERTPLPVRSWDRPERAAPAALRAEGTFEAPAVVEPSTAKPDDKPDAHV